MAINSSTYNVGTPLGGILNALKTVETYYGIKGAMQKADELSRAAEISKQASDPTSAISEQSQQERVGALKAASQQGLIPKDSADSLIASMLPKKGTEAVPAQRLIGPAEQSGAVPMTKEVAATPGSPGMSAAQLDASLKEGGPLFSIIKGKQAADAMAAKMAGLVGVKQQQLAETQNKNSNEVGQAFEKDSIIKAAKGNLNSLGRSMSILDNTSKPLLAKDLNLAYTDYINAVAAGGAATEGKIHRELPENFETQWNDLKSRVGQFDDIRKDKTGSQLVDMLKNNISTVSGDLTKAKQDQALNLYDSFKQNSNPKVQDALKSKMAAYHPGAYSEIYGQSAPKQPGQASGGSPFGGANANASTGSNSIMGVSHDDIAAELAKRKKK